MNPIPPVRCAHAPEGGAPRRFSVDDVEAMVRAGILDEEERVELIDGEVVLMSPKGSRHVMVHQALVEHWIRVSPADCSVVFEGGHKFSKEDYLEPDIAIHALREGAGGPTLAGLLLLVEVADSSLRFDVGRKAKRYAQFGVPEYWAVDAVKMTTRVFRSAAKAGYREERDYEASEILTPVVAPPIFAIRLDALKLISGFENVVRMGKPGDAP
jgi:Uma2 family endonuclease